MSTLLQLRDAAREVANMENSTFVTDSELTRYINEEVKDLYLFIVGKYENYYVTEIPFTIDAGQDGYAFPDGYMKFLALDRVEGNFTMTVQPYTFNERNRYQNSIAFNWVGPVVLYDIQGGSIKLKPASSAPGSYVMFMVPTPPKLVADDDTLDSTLTVWEEYVINGAAAKCLIKEESDPSMLLGRQQQLQVQIVQMAANRDAGRPQVIGDYSRWDDDEYWRF